MTDLTTTLDFDAWVAEQRKALLAQWRRPHTGGLR